VFFSFFTLKNRGSFFPLRKKKSFDK